MLFGKKENKEEITEEPATRYGRAVNESRKPEKRVEDTSSFFARLFGQGHDRDFIYYED